MSELTSQIESPPVLRIAELDETHPVSTHLAGTASGRAAKRVLDVCLALPVVFLVLPPLCLLVMLGHKWQSPGPIFFRQVRAGRRHQKFRIFKFRTMSVAAEGQSEIEGAHARIFPLGSLLRRSKVDELPQFINVLLGQMSIVGPRPHHFDDCEQFSEEIPEYNQRFAVKPGITGLAQYEEFCGKFQWNCLNNRVQRDLIYIESWSPLGDVRLILATAAAVGMRVIGGAWRRAIGVVRPAPAPAVSVKAKAEVETILPEEKRTAA